MLERSPYSRWIGLTVGGYRLEQGLGQNELGPLFTARNLENNATCLVRVLATPAAQTPDAHAVYAARLKQEAARVAALQHPYILPLIDYGLHAGLPYLVWPGLVMRSLSTRLAQSGPLDVVSVGRYVDQIAAALEAAHQQNILHRNLSADNVFIQLDGHLLVADIGVRRLVELLRGDDGGIAYYGSMEACAPEQLGDGRVGAYTDVYALGALTFRLLTGRPVFTAESPEALLEQHLYAQPDQLRAVRAGLPVALDGVVQTALAKDPTRRFAQPGAFADAYQQVVAPNSMMRVSFSATPNADNARPRSNPPNLSDPTRAPSRPRGSGALRANAATTLDERPDVSVASRPLAVDAQWLDDERNFAALKRRQRSRRVMWRVGVAAALIIIVAANALFLSGAFSGHKGAAGVATGDVAFLDGSSATPGGTDAVQIVLRNVSAPPAGYSYYAWIINQASEQTTPLGQLRASQQTYTLRYASPAAGAGVGVNLLTLGDLVEVTLEQGSVALPVGKVVLSAKFPPQAFVHIQHLLVSFPTTPGKIGLLVGVLDQTQEVEAQATLLQNAASAANATAV
ncbi:MAG TPA: serine/threonine-protein kinase, partial [Ktedonobacterales bacterium]|nr:serine/threonine-protein kinase [Ktedonobacterales bacterium]